ncbi:hypothetical protein ACFL9T_01510 [Thermodesulfobacteriota bacterium]
MNEWTLSVFMGHESFRWPPPFSIPASKDPPVIPIFKAPRMDEVITDRGSIDSGAPPTSSR